MHGIIRLLKDNNNSLHFLTENHDIIFLSETWSNNSHNFSNILPGYHLHFINATNNTSIGRSEGGLMLYMKSNISNQLNCIKINNSGIWLKTLDHTSNKPTIFGFIYAPSKSDKKKQLKILEDIFDDLNSIKTMYGQTDIYISGDFNCRIAHHSGSQTIKLPNRKNRDLILNHFGKVLIDTCILHNLVVVNGRSKNDAHGAYTFIGARGASTIDLLLTTSQNFNNVLNFQVLPLSGSDHLPISMTISFKFRKTATHAYPMGKLAINSSKLKTFFDSDVGKETSNVICQTTSPSSAFNIFYGIVEDCMCIRRNKPKSIKTWYNHECRRLDQKLNILAESLKTSENYQSDSSSYKTLKLYIKTRKEEIKTTYIDKQIEIIKSLHPNSKTFWSFFSRNENRPNIEIPLLSLEEHFSKTFFKNNTQMVFERNESGITDPTLDSDITIEEITNALNNCKKRSSPGIDNWTYTIIQENYSNLKYIICHLFNLTLYHGFTPPQWKISKLIPIFKGGDKNNPKNYRPINLLSCLYKLYSRIMTYRLDQWCLLNQIFKPNQFGFRKGLSTIDACFTLFTVIQKYTTTRKDNLITVFIDFKAAFDSIDRLKLKQKLELLGISQKFINAIFSMLTDNKYFVTTGDQTSSLYDVNIGVKQGDTISPLLFSLYINDLDEAIGNPNTYMDGNLINSILYADDVAIFAKNAVEMEIILKNVKAYCDKNSLIVNVLKTKCLTFHHPTAKIRSTTPHTFYFNEEEIENVESFKYLGVTFDKRINFSLNSKEIRKKCIAAISKILNSDFPTRCLTNNQLKNLLEAKIISIVRYSAPLWGFKRYQELEKIPVQYYKLLLCLPKFTPTILLQKEFGIFSLFSVTFSSCISYLWKLSFSQNIFLQSCLNYYLQNNCVVNWHRRVVGVFEEYDMSPKGMVESIGRIPKNVLISSILKQIQNKEIENINNIIQEKYSEPYILNSTWNHYSKYGSLNIDFDLKRILILIRTKTCFLHFSKLDSLISCPFCSDFFHKNDLTFHIMFRCPLTPKIFLAPSTIPEEHVIFEFLTTFIDAQVHTKQFCKTFKNIRAIYLGKV